MINQVVGRLKTASKIVTLREYDALDLLRADHMKVEALLLQLRIRRDDIARTKLLRQIKTDLDLHMRIEEELFYPACRANLRLKAIVEPFVDDHHEIRDLISELGSLKPSTQRYSQIVNRLLRAIEQHVYAEENHLIPLVRKHLEKAEFARLSKQMISMHEGVMPRRTTRRARIKRRVSRVGRQRKAA